MKKIIIIITLISFYLIQFANAKCGDSFCDPNENCESCSTDCLCTIFLETHKKSKCCAEFDCRECEEGYCKEKECEILKAHKKIFKKIECYSNGSIGLEVDLDLEESGQTSNGFFIDSNKQIKVFMKPNNQEKTFEEIKGTWISSEPISNYPNKLKGGVLVSFSSDLDIFDNQGEYFVRVKIQENRGSAFYEDELVNCPGYVKEKTEETTILEPKINETKNKELPKEGFFKRVLGYITSIFTSIFNS